MGGSTASGVGDRKRPKLKHAGCGAYNGLQGSCGSVLGWYCDRCRALMQLADAAREVVEAHGCGSGEAEGAGYCHIDHLEAVLRGLTDEPR